VCVSVRAHVCFLCVRGGCSGRGRVVVRLVVDTVAEVVVFKLCVCVRVFVCV